MNNKEIIRRVYADIFNGRNLALIKDFIREDYIQHNPEVDNGIEGVVKYFNQLFTKFPHFRIDIKRIIAEGDYVVVHTNAVGVDLPQGAAVVDIYRLENGKIVEHWDVIQPVPEKTANGHTMF
ncbi:MAG: ester cyclase [Dehalococcoidales bacterium]|nr:ester cyclase [Dehalococcoidales bacterium]